MMLVCCSMIRFSDKLLLTGGQGDGRSGDCSRGVAEDGEGGGCLHGAGRCAVMGHSHVYAVGGQSCVLTAGGCFCRVVR